MEKTDTITEVILSLLKLYTKYGDIPICMCVEEMEYSIDSINYTTTEDGDSYISINNF
jgi:hypothetical protein